MARAKAVLPPPSGEQVSGALETLKQRVIAELAKIPGLVPGSEPWVAALPRLVTDQRILAASHCDFESPTDGVCEFACGDVDPKRQASVRRFVRDAVGALLPRGGTPAH